MMGSCWITAIFSTILFFHVSGRPDGQISNNNSEDEDVTERYFEVVSGEAVTDIKFPDGMIEDSRKKRDAEQSDDDEEEYDYYEEMDRIYWDYDENFSEEDDEDENSEVVEEDNFDRVFDLKLDEAPTSADGLMEDYYLVL